MALITVRAAFRQQRAANCQPGGHVPFVWYVRQESATGVRDMGVYAMLTYQDLWAVLEVLCVEQRWDPVEDPDPRAPKVVPRRTIGGQTIN